MAEDKQYLKDLKADGLGRHSTDIVRFQRSGSRLDEDDIEEAVIQDYRSKIAANEFEIRTVENPLASLTSDQYYGIIPAKYFEQKTDDKIAEELHCDSRTVRRNKNRLINRLAVRFYGVEAL